MRKVEFWQAFDGAQFSSKESCEQYEHDHSFFDKTHIQFFSNNGFLINEPCDCVFLDSNRFKVYNEETLKEYIDYCNNLGIQAPHLVDPLLPYPLHYHFMNGRWQCIEEEIAALNFAIGANFNDNVIEEGFVCHNKT